MRTLTWDEMELVAGGRNSGRSSGGSSGSSGSSRQTVNRAEKTSLPSYTQQRNQTVACGFFSALTVGAGYYAATMSVDNPAVSGISAGVAAGASIAAGVTCGKAFN
jgi:hypothetical protein